MGLYERLMEIETPKISVHNFMAVLAERKRGFITTNQVITNLALSTAEQTELQRLVARVLDLVTPLTAIEIHDVLIMSEHGGVPYTTVEAVKTRFGV